MDVSAEPATLSPAALPAAVIDAITACANACRTTLSRLEGERERLRTALGRRIAPAPEGPARRLCAVDGANATVPASGATFAAVAAVAVEEAALTDQEVLVRLMPPVEELESILGGIRTMLELRLLARRVRATTSGLFVLDGSFYSALLDVNRLLVRYAQDARGGRPLPEWWGPFRELIEVFFAEEDWQLVLSCRRVVAHPKQATAADDVAQLAPHLSGTVTDRTLWSTVLEPGEYALPVPLIKQDRPHLLTGSRAVGEGFGPLRAAIEQGYGQLYVIYYRPDAAGPAYRLELPAALIAREPLGAVLATFRSALRVGAVQEPLPQFLADAICRQVGRALEATAEGARTTLQNEFGLPLTQRYLGPYRTPRG
ncbi:MAG TPA: DNA double-strand break repair nuclease NurA [Roseiflexaceae bacterium]|nr:DNA double-strand break repair nuclease NurA [Roseiflexaceae bacterium]